MANISQLKPSLDVLQDIARYIQKPKHCVKLATNLGLTEDFVCQVKAGRFAGDIVAMKVLCRWREEKSSAATGRALFDALVGSSKDVAICFAERLLGESKN